LIKQKNFLRNDKISLWPPSTSPCFLSVKQRLNSAFV
jgi:hypothetical protein